MSQPLTELREELAAKRDLQQQIVDEATYTEGSEEAHDLKRVECLGSAINKLEGGEKASRVAEIAAEIDQRIESLEELIATEEVISGYKASSKRREEERKNRPTFPADTKARLEGKGMDYRQIAKRITDDPIFKAWQRGNRDGRIDIDASLFEAKTLMTTSSGWAGESTRTGVAVDIALRPPQLLDILPKNTTGQPSIVWMQQTTRTQAAAEVSEGGAKPEAAFVWSETSSPVEEIAVQIPVTDRMMEDSPQIQGLIETQLREDMVERLDQQCLEGNGTPPNLSGILDQGSILTTAVSGGNMPHAIMRAMRLIRTGVSRAIPTHVLMNPVDYEDMVLQPGTNDDFLFGGPGEMTIPRVWGLPIIQNEEIVEDTVLVGAFSARNIQLYERRGISVEQGWIGDQFKENKRTIKMWGRWALAVYRPTAFCTVTGFDT